MSNSEKNVMIIGAGAMGKAIASNLIASKWKGKVTLTVKSEERRKEVGQEINGSGIKLKVGNLTDLHNSDIIIIAVKPQSISVLCKELAGKIELKTILVSIVAGVDTDSLVKGFQHEKIVRCMPNTALTVGKSITTWIVASKNRDDQVRVISQQIFQLWGMEHQVCVESHLDMATAIFGTGPALIYHFVNEFYEAAIHIGFPKNNLMKMIMYMVVGTVELAEKQRDKHLSELINQVTSPGGTTTEALYVFKKRGLGATITEGVKAAFDKINRLRQT